MMKLFHTHLLFLLLTPFISFEQDTTFTYENPVDYDSLKLLYPFLDLHSNKLSGDSASMQNFYGKLLRIKAGSHEQAVVVHIGDSHVQPGIITQPLREWLQADFGNAGRGIIFPYRLAKSNGPAGYSSHTDTPWIYGRNATEKRPLPTGIAGFTLWSASLSASFTVTFTVPQCRASDSCRLLIFHETRDSCYSFNVSNQLTGRQYVVLDSTASNTTTFLIDDEPQTICVGVCKTRPSQNSATFYGMSLESVIPGVIVHTIGVNGARFSSFLDSEHFIRQLEMLHPDLLIFSLGTNESFDVKGFSRDKFRAVLDSLIGGISRAGINADIILTTPPGIYKSYRKKRRMQYKPNPVAEMVSEELRQYGAGHGISVWDWYTIMGGREGMAKWKAKKMTDRRYIHFTARGYAVEGTLLLEAVRNSFNALNIPETGQTPVLKQP